MNLIQILQKRADLKATTVLQPQQIRVVDRIGEEPAVLVYHGLGSGKTLASIAAGEEMPGRKEIIVPAALRQNYAKELKKFIRGKPKDYDVKSYTKAVTEGVGKDEPVLTIFDEAHRTGREGTGLSKLPGQARGKIMFLTGTPVRNEPSELVPLLKVLAKDRGAPVNAKSFNELFVGERRVFPGVIPYLAGVRPGSEQYLRNKDKLKAMLTNRVDYHASQGEFPQVSEEIIETDMLPRQESVYKGVLASNPILAYKVRYNLPPSKSESQHLNAFLTATRQVSNNPKSYDVSLTGSALEYSPKLQRMAQDLTESSKKDPNFKALVYSNYLDSGILPLAEEMKQRGEPVGIFTGQLNDTERADLVNQYNAGKIKLLFVSGAGSEGLDLKGTKMVQLMEPHWNKARLDQVIGRAVRHGSHAHLPEEERKVQVRKYFVKPRASLMSRIGLTTADTGADRYLSELSGKKQKLVDELLAVLQEASVKEADYAEGLPDPGRFGRTQEIPSGKLLQYVVQRHLAERAGPHYDVRFGEGRKDRPDLFSWATKKELPGPGGKIMLYQQPLHRGQYAEFEGTLLSGYGKGVVKKHDRGTVIVTHADKDKIKFVVAHRKFPEYFTMVRQSGPPGQPRTERQAKSQGGSWLLINTTPVSAAKFLGGKPEEVGLNKLRYTKIPEEKIEKLFDPKYMVQEKMDGASALIHLLGDRIEAVSYRVAKGGHPIIHTFRVFGPAGAKTSVKIPPELQGTILRGEVYGTKGKEVIPPQQLGGLLNASVQRSLEKQKELGIDLKVMPFDIVRHGKETVPPLSLSAEERMNRLREIVKHLPQNKFRLPETAQTPLEAKSLVETIKRRMHPRTQEGVIAWPREAGKAPVKAKFTPEADVWVKNIFPGGGKLTGSGAGGFEYSLSPTGPVVGRVGTGFSDEVRREMLADPEGWLNRMARIRAQDKFPSGAYRAPAFIALHEDYPMKAE